MTTDERESLRFKEIQAGTVLNQRYELHKQIGRGAYGEVWHAHDLLNGHLEVAIKLLRDEQSSMEARQRFERECSALELLMPHPNIVAIRGRGMFQNKHYMVLELIHGQRLADWIGSYKDKNLPELTHVLDLFAQVCVGVSAAHQVNNPGPIIHRDIKPENIMLVPNPLNLWSGQSAKLLDFGVVRLGDYRQTAPGQQLGTPLYMSPEQVAGDETAIGPWSDVFSLGVVLVELLTLRATGPNESSLRGFIKKVGPRGMRQYIRQLRSDLPGRLCDLVIRALSLRPAGRFSDAHQLLSALQVAVPQLNILTHSWTNNESALTSRRSAPDRKRMSGYRRSIMAGAGFLSIVVGTAAIRSRRSSNIPTPTAAGAASTLRPAIWPEGMVYVPGGAFSLGCSEERAKEQVQYCRLWFGLSSESCDKFKRQISSQAVTISHYFLSRYEVTNQQYAQFLNTRAPRPRAQRQGRQVIDNDGSLLADLYPEVGGIEYKNGIYQVLPGREQWPVVQITWDGAQRYCEAQHASLPTEAQWEFAAKGTENRLFPWGNGTVSCSGVTFGRGTAGLPCAHLPPQPTNVGAAIQDESSDGVRDLAGNVAEWVYDVATESYPACTPPCLDPVTKLSATGLQPALPTRVNQKRSFRGCGYDEILGLCTTTFRGQAPREATWPGLGFRCAAPIPPREPLSSSD